MYIPLVNKGKIIGKVTVDDEKPFPPPFMRCSKTKSNRKAYFYRTYKEAVSALTPTTQLWVFRIYEYEYHPYTLPPPLLD